MSVRTRPAWLRVCVLLCLVVPLLGGSTAFGAQPRRIDGPMRVAVAYIAALDRHDGAAVCRLFSPQLRSFEIQRDPLRGRDVGHALRRLPGTSATTTAATAGHPLESAGRCTSRSTRGLASLP